MTVLPTRKTTIWITIVFAILMTAGCGQDKDETAADGVGVRRDPGAPSSSSTGSLTLQQRAVVAETLAYAEINDQLVKGHFAFPEDMIESYPAIILIHEWWGLNDEVRALADRIAAEGFVVLAVDLYDGRIAATPPNARELMLKVVENPDFAAMNIQQACNWVRTIAGAEQVAVVGYGLGGSWSLNAAIALPGQLDAAVMFYGQVSNNEETLSPIDAPILGFFGGADTIIPADSVAGFEDALQTLRKTYDINVYPGAKGGFASRGNRNFDTNLASKSWDAMLKFLREHLDGEEAGDA